jgi:D-amino-acid dehydrogenase
LLPQWRATPALVALGIACIYPAKGVTVTVPARLARWPPGSIIDDTRLFGLIRLGDRYRCSGSVEFDGWNTTPTPTRGKAIVDNVISVFPQFAGCYDPSTAQFWAGCGRWRPPAIPISARRRSATCS